MQNSPLPTACFSERPQAVHPSLCMPGREALNFKDPVGKTNPLTSAAPAAAVAEPETKGHRYILCRQCANMVTDPNQGTWINGSHRHTFANPIGVVYEIGCFSEAPGCRPVGPASDEFTWFAGYLWRVSICSKCLTHLGWQFLSSAGHGFFGLIFDRLIEQEKQD